MLALTDSTRNRKKNKNMELLQFQWEAGIAELFKSIGAHRSY